MTETPYFYLIVTAFCMLVLALSELTARLLNKAIDRFAGWRQKRQEAKNRLHVVYIRGDRHVRFKTSDGREGSQPLTGGHLGAIREIEKSLQLPQGYSWEIL